VSEHERSGLSVREFATQRGLSAASLYVWRSRLGVTRGRGKKRAGRLRRRPERDDGEELVAVELIGAADGLAADDAGGLEVAVGDVRIRVPRGFDGAELLRLVSALRSAC